MPLGLARKTRLDELLAVFMWYVREDFVVRIALLIIDVYVILCLFVVAMLMLMLIGFAGGLRGAEGQRRQSLKNVSDVIEVRRQTICPINNCLIRLKGAYFSV